MIDSVILQVGSGRGGRGAVSFRHEKYVPFGGPDGGDGGRGGDLIVTAVDDRVTLGEYRQRKRYQAKNGNDGTPRNKTGKSGESLSLSVPAGTLVKWTHEGTEEIIDLDEVGASVVVCHGGDGGRGNSRFRTSTNRAPRLAETGLESEEVELELELKLLADVGVVGLPNAGKSSLLAAASGANPQIGAYPFTTTEPNLGVVNIGWASIVVADIPGMIEGAHEGKGLGDRFLRHVERTAVLIHVVDGEDEDPLGSWRTVNEELRLYGEGLDTRPQLVVINKVDIPEVVGRQAELETEFAAAGVQLDGFISAATGEGVTGLMRAAHEMVKETREAQREKAAAAGTPKRVVVLRPPPANIRPEVTQLADGEWRVTDPRVERLAGGVNMNDSFVEAQFWSELNRIGAVHALEAAGAKPGDSVLIGSAEMTWR
jgi:GTP-binding protein